MGIYGYRPYGAGRMSWPQLLGKPAAQAKAIIERELPGVTAVIIGKGSYLYEDICCNRVRLIVNHDPQRTVAEVPVLG
ncbi:hypothetical protein MKW98_009269 [Papaver atlanticum]|uniref:Uncharacterized protein n=1 Tax=Papaver atlanticum TaxID=357466 RepID=A0AAD4T0X4_9MAGN|nr:hypothetical protein MKW98_009269 [Papaver atlanticum]